MPRDQNRTAATVCPACEERDGEICTPCANDLESYGYGKAQQEREAIVLAFRARREDMIEEVALLRRSAPPEGTDTPQNPMRARMLAAAQVIEDGVKALDALKGST